MNKCFNIILSAVCACLLLVSCSDDMVGNGEGKVNLKFLINENVETFTRAGGDETLSENCIIYIYNSKGLIRKYRGIDNVPAEIWLVSGDYRVEAMAGVESAASFTDKYFRGESDFTITQGKTADVTVTCKITNVVASVKMASNIGDALTGYTVTVGNSEGSLDFTASNADAKGYYTMPEGETTLNWTITGTMVNGEKFEKSGSVSDVKPATEYVLNVTYNPSESLNVGGTFLTVSVDATEIEVNEGVEICTAPQILLGGGLNINEAVAAEPGTLDNLTIYGCAAAELTSLSVESTAFTSPLGLPSNSFDFINMEPDVLADLQTKGFTFHSNYNSAKDETIAKLIIGKTLLDKLTVGDYQFTVKAADANNQSRTKVINISITNAPVSTTALTLADVNTLSATLRGAILKSDVTSPGFKYRERGTSDWISAAATESGSTFSAAITKLKAGTTYEYVATTPSFTASDVKTFTTGSALQLPNAGFESWNTSSSPYLLYGSGESKFWDSGNHGSATLKVNITTPDGSVKHSGNYSVKMASQKVAFMGIGKFAAGNVFIGEYLATVGTDGILGFGRPFAARPKALHGYVRYEPATMTEGSDSDYQKFGLTKGSSKDKGNIYVALCTSETMTTTNGSTTYSWDPQIIRTGSSPVLFDKNAPKVVAYGEKIFTEATAGDGLVEFTIPLDYRNNGVMPASIIVVASASYYGDYFIGGNSTMWLDDLELIYE